MGVRIPRPPPLIEQVVNPPQLGCFLAMSAPFAVRRLENWSRANRQFEPSDVASRGLVRIARLMQSTPHLKVLGSPRPLTGDPRIWSAAWTRWRAACSSESPPHVASAIRPRGRTLIHPRPLRRYSRCWSNATISSLVALRCTNIQLLDDEGLYDSWYCPVQAMTVLASGASTSPLPRTSESG